MIQNLHGDSDLITREYFDSILLETRLIGSDLADTHVSLFGKEFENPITTAALSHLNSHHPEGLAEMARGAKSAGSLVFIGMGDPSETARVAETGASVIKIVKPYADEGLIFERLDQAKKSGCFGVGMDIDHTFSRFGGYDNVMGFQMNAKSEADLKRYMARTGLPFVMKGILSVSDALKCAELGAQGIVVSHHHGIMKSAVPPLYLLPKIREAVGDSLTIFLDCDVENGFDVFKALALGANAVSVGRAIMPPLRENAAQGVCDRILEINGELRAAMARTGAKSIAEIDPTALHFFGAPVAP